MHLVMNLRGTQVVSLMRRTIGQRKRRRTKTVICCGEIFVRAPPLSAGHALPTHESAESGAPGHASS